MHLLSKPSYTRKYLLFGVAFGFCFPVFSLLLDILIFKNLVFSLESLGEVHFLNPLHFIIDTAPLFLGIAFGFAGRNLDEISAIRQNVEQTNEELIQQNQIVTQYSHELQAQSDELNHQHIKVEKLLEDIQASVRTAERLQLALLPEVSDIQQAFKEAFVIYKAKDIVSGDFYWFREVNYQQEKYQIVVVGDCTGHGIPGSLMTIVGYFLLERIVEKDLIMSPHQILHYLNEGITEAFSSKISTLDKYQVREGMDASVLVINRTTQQIQYAGAHRPLFYVVDDELMIVKGSRLPLGGEKYKQREKSFELNTIPYQENTVFYLFSDGFPDQFGGIQNKKFGSKRLKELLRTHTHKNLSEQHQVLLSTFQKWKKDTPQTDDVVFLGIKI